MVRTRTSLMIALLVAASPIAAQRQTGEIRLSIEDPSGAPLRALVTVTGRSSEVRQTLLTPGNGELVLPVLPWGRYQLQVERSGFERSVTFVEVGSEVPQKVKIVLGVAVVETALRVTISDTLAEPGRTGATRQIGSSSLESRRPSVPAREILTIVDSQPGWLLEANGVLHPRGSEYGVQYVIDGLPYFDNRSPAFAPMLDIEEFQSLVIRTGGYPAEYGHQLGGVVEVTTNRDRRPGFHGKMVAEGGSFNTSRGASALQYLYGRNVFGLTGSGMTTDRYLDPPVKQNFSNHGSGGGFSSIWERDWTGTRRTRLVLRRNRTGFLVPNEEVQEAAGQRQDRTSGETAGHLSYTQVLSPSVLFDVRGSGRDIDARLWSNPFPTPIAPSQSRGFRELYGTASLAVHSGRHELKFGAEALFRSVREQFAYRIVDDNLNGVRIFDRDTPRRFEFADARQNREQGAFVQDHIRLGSLTIDAGVRWDHYRFVVDEHAFSPRAAAAWQIPRTGLVVRASYDRAFQTPAIENLLLASSEQTASLGDEGFRLPIRPSRGNFYEAGLTKALFGRVRLDASYFRRDVRDFQDDEVLLNTGVSFPITFASASIRGFEAKLDIPKWGPMSGFISYTNMTGQGRLPIAGGLFLDDDAASLLDRTDTFSITQDQRNTVRAQVRGSVTSRLWAGASAQYGSGLPVETEEGSGRVRPSLSVDLSAGAEVWRREGAVVRLQGSVLNLLDRFNVINLAGLFSGTALAPGRWASMRLAFEF